MTVMIVTYNVTLLTLTLSSNKKINKKKENKKE